MKTLLHFLSSNYVVPSHNLFLSPQVSNTVVVAVDLNLFRLKHFMDL